MTDPRLCLICDQPVPTGFGRPRIYCSIDCRRESYRRCRELREMEEQLLDVLTKVALGYGPGADFWVGTAARLEREIADLRRVIPEALLHSGRA